MSKITLFSTERLIIIIGLKYAWLGINDDMFNNNSIDNYVSQN